MKIYNFNRPTYQAFWNSWRSYYRELNHQANSLLDYQFYYNPPYDILNSANRSSSLSTDQLKELKIIQYRIGKQYNGEPEYTTFMSDFATDSSLAISEVTVPEGVCKYFSSGASYVITAFGKNENYVGYIKCSGTTYFASGSLIFESNYCFEDDTTYNSWNAMANLSTSGSYKTASLCFCPQYLYYHQGVNNLLNKDSSYCLVSNAGTQASDYKFYSFKAGYAIINNTQPVGNDTGLLKNSIDNYLCYPIGNGGYFIWNSVSNKTLTTYYYANELGAFSNNTIFNLSNFYLRLVYNFNWSSNTQNLNILNSGICDISGNQWDGKIQETDDGVSIGHIQEYEVVNYEEFIDNNQFSISTYINPTTYTKYSTFNIKKPQNRTFTDLKVLLI